MPETPRESIVTSTQAGGLEVAGDHPPITGLIEPIRAPVVGQFTLLYTYTVEANKPGAIAFIDNVDNANTELGRIYSDANGLTFTTKNGAKLSLTDNGTAALGDLVQGPVLSSHGRMALNGGELLYLLNKNGVVVGKEWGGNGNLSVEGTLSVSQDVVLTGADCAEDFDVASSCAVDPGSVMIIDESGKLQPASHEYDKRVAGVVSGGGEFRPGLTLDRKVSSIDRQPIALVGKVFCKVDAKYGAIEIGDMLTTSPTTGYAMKVVDPSKAFGAVIGKALQHFSEGQGLIPILVSLQ